MLSCYSPFMWFENYLIGIYTSEHSGTLIIHLKWAQVNDFRESGKLHLVT